MTTRQSKDKDATKTDTTTNPFAAFGFDADPSKMMAPWLEATRVWLDESEKLAALAVSQADALVDNNARWAKRTIAAANELTAEMRQRFSTHLDQVNTQVAR